MNETNKTLARAFMEQAFNQGDLSVVDQFLTEDGVDHQEPSGTPFRPHIRESIMMLRTAFPDLHFEIHDMLAEGELVAMRSTMTGTHLGTLNFGAARGLAPTGRKVSVAHIHFIRVVDGQNTDLWHQWDIPGLMRQLGAMPEPQRRPA